MTRIFAVILLIAFTSETNASLWEDILDWFGDDDTTQTAEETASATAPTAGKKASEITQQATAQGLSLLSQITQGLGVSEVQAKGGLGALFTATRALLPPEDFDLIESAVPDMQGYLDATPPSNEVIGGAMNLLGGSEGTTALANLAGQFNALGLDTGQVAGFARETMSYLESQSPAAAEKLESALGDYL